MRPKQGTTRCSSRPRFRTTKCSSGDALAIRQYDIYVVGLDPTIGSEVQKTRPCVVISPDEMNRHLRTVQIAPLTSNDHAYPWRVQIRFRRTPGRVALDQIRTVDRARLLRRAGRASPPVVAGIKRVIHEMLVS